MSKLQNVWVVAETENAFAELIAGAATLGDRITVLRCECGESESWLNCIPPIADIVKDAKPNLVLVSATQNGRLTAGAIAAAMETSVLAEAVELAVKDGMVIGKRIAHGGAAFKTERASGNTIVATVGAGVFESNPAQMKEQAAETVLVSPAESKVRLIEKRRKESRTVNLPAAQAIVGVGRGFGSEENLKLAYALAEAIGAEVGCSRPVAEENKWLPKEFYIGVTGVKIKPNVYVCCGISGQIQHLTGANASKSIVAINKDSAAPIFKQCDFGIVADLTKVLPALTEKFAAG